jgi:transposase
VEWEATEVEVLNDPCCGLDVHKKTVVACVLRSSLVAQTERRDTAEREATLERKTRSFSTMTQGLLELADWLIEQGVSQVVMESTGVYWKPIFDVLEERGDAKGQPFTLLLANAQHVRQVPGRKTDVKDAEWLATLLRHGLIRGSFVPDREQRELRELTRYRTALLHDRAREVNRLQKTLEGANIKLSVVLTDITGVSGQRILDALLSGESDPDTLADLAHWRVQSKREALEQAVVGKLSSTLRFVVLQQMRHLRELDTQIEECDREVERVLSPFEAEVQRLKTIPGVGPRTAQVVIAEIGVDMSRFPSADHLAAWAGMSPGQNQSGGKSRMVPTRKGSAWLKAALAESAWAASKARSGYLPAQYRRLAGRRGRKRAIVAVGHSILVIVYHLLKDGEGYSDLGSNYFDERDREEVVRRLTRRLQSLGFQVTTPPQAESVPAASFS